MEEYQVITDSIVNVNITSSISSFAVEKRYPKNLSIGELKVNTSPNSFWNCIIPTFQLFASQGKLELVTGASAGSMILELYNREKQFICALTNDNALLGSFPVDNGMRIHVTNKLFFVNFNFIFKYYF